jgi:hypothetical protein
MSRRRVVQMIAALASAPLLPGCATAPEPAQESTGAADPARRSGPAGTLTDPDLVNPVVPWARTLEAEQLATLAVLCRVIIPADEVSPGADELGAHDFIDEWVSAPYENMREDRQRVVEGLAWLDEESQRRFGADFKALADTQHGELCDLICDPRDVAPELETAAGFFDRVRTLTAMAFYTTPQGMADVGYVGNTPLPAWAPPPPEALRHVGLIED